MLPAALRTSWLALAWLLATGASAGELRDLYFGEALYHAKQGYYFDALERLDAELGQHYGLDEPERDSLYAHLGEAEFFVGDFELSYRMHHRAGRAIRAVLEGDVDREIRNEAAFRLARIHFQKGQMTEALEALRRIEGRLPEGLRQEVPFLQANVLLAMGRPSDAAEILRRLQGASSLKGFSSYNLGIALLQNGEQAVGLEQLDRAGRIDAREPASQAIRDKANLTLGTLLLDDGEYSWAKTSLERVRLEGPFSNQALLGSGWAAMSESGAERALVPWSILVRREPTDAAVQEVMLALPYAYGQLELHGRAAVFYGQALERFGQELDKLKSSIRSVREGRFLEALIREEIHQDKDWVVRLRMLPETPETFYLVELLASHDFQTGLKNYLDLEELRRKLSTWQSDFDAYGDLIDARRAFYEPQLPAVDHDFRRLDSRIRLRLEQYEHLARRLEEQLIMPRPEFLATTEERVANQRLVSFSEALGPSDGQANDDLRERIERLKGLLTWAVRTEYDERLNRFDRNLRELKDSVDVLDAQYERFVRVRQAAEHSYSGYERPLARLKTRVGDALRSVERLMARQGHQLETVALRELEQRKKRLEGYYDQAQYALADSYDRAARAQALGSD